ncbi:MAG: hypothetical protein ACJASK_001564, partial [Ilumatobacter sp.]
MFAARIEELANANIDVLDTALAAAKRKRDEADVDIAAITAVVDARQLFQEHAQSSIKAYLKQQLNCSGPDALRIKRRARLFNQHPEIADVFNNSRIAGGQVDAMATAQQHPRSGDQFADFAALFIDQAERLEHDEFADVIKHFIVQADQDGAFNDQKFHEDQRTASVRIDDGAITMHARGGDPLSAAEMKRIFDLAVEAEAHKDFETRRSLHGNDALAHPMPRSGDQRRFDAIYAIFMASVTAPADGKRPEPLVNIVIDAATGLEVLARHGLLDLTNNDHNNDHNNDLAVVDPASRRCATSTGIALHPDIALQAMLAGSIRRVMVDAHDVVINMGRTQRLFTGKARQAAQLLAVRCGFRGCDIPAEFCDVDHITPWVNGGNTDQANSMPLCGPHDRQKHSKQLQGRRDRHGRIHLITPNGTIIKPLNAPDPHWAKPEPDQPHPISRIRRLRYTWDQWVAIHP